MGYFTASIEWAKNTNNPEAWKDWWYNPEAKIFNFIGKDNIPFHTLIWQSELLGVGRIYEEDPEKQLNLPYDVPANEFMNIEGQAFSKSRNWAVWLPDILTRYDPDAIRFYVASAIPETRDSDFSWSEFLSRNNDELVATWGNLANRVLSFAYKHWDGVVPEAGDLRPEDEELLDEIERGFTEVGNLLEAVKIRAGLREILRLAREVNGYLDRAPWFSVIKTDKSAAGTTVYTALRAIDTLKILFAPYLPFSSQQLHQTLGYEGSLFGELNIETIDEEQRSHKILSYDGSKAIGRWQPSQLKPGQVLQRPKPLFKKLDDSIVDEERSRLGNPSE
jgi:methionyl-tRNA synthetase